MFILILSNMFDCKHNKKENNNVRFQHYEVKRLRKGYLYA